MKRALVGEAPVRVPGERKPFQVPCLVAVTPFGFPDPGLTVAIKATVSFSGAEGPRVRATFVEPRPWSVEPPAPDTNEPLPDDLVPYKPRADVVVVGELEILPTPSGGALTRTCAVRIAGAALSFAVSSQAAGRVPLRAPWLSLIGPGEPRVGARATVDPDDIGAFEEDFDFGVFQSANPALTVDALPKKEPLLLRGVHELDGELEVELPELEPRVVIDWVMAGEELEEVPLALDTLVIDVGRRTIDLVWRGNAAAPDRGLEDVDRVLVSFAAFDPELAGESADRELVTAMRELPRGRFGYAWLRADAKAASAPPPLSPEELQMARHEALDLPLGPEPTLSLEEHANVAAELLEDKPPRDEVLKRHGLDELTWGLEERALAERLGTAPKESGGVHEVYSRHFQAALERLARPEEDAVTARDYADLTVQLERGEPKKTLAEARLSFGSWLRIDRRWRAAMQADPQLAAEIEARMASERERLGEPPEPEMDEEGNLL